MLIPEEAHLRAQLDRGTYEAEVRQGRPVADTELGRVMAFLGPQRGFGGSRN